VTPLLRPARSGDLAALTALYNHCGQGLGARLYEVLLASLAGEDLHRLYAGVTLPDPASVRLHERRGFRRVGLFREVGRKAGRFWDVAWYEKDLG
jgi:phosphinothricin acetyltransferase